MVKVAQLGIAVSLLGVVVTLMGLFPGLMGVNPTPGLGVIQILILQTGFILLIMGALLYVRVMFYANQPLTLLQQVGIRLALTGLTFTALTALADVLGFGSNLRVADGDILLGPLQMTGLLISFAVASLGVILFAVAGNPVITEE
jgi:hypothetical protein